MIYVFKASYYLLFSILVVLSPKDMQLEKLDLPMAKLLVEVSSNSRSVITLTSRAENKFARSTYFQSKSLICSCHPIILKHTSKSSGKTSRLNPARKTQHRFSLHKRFKVPNEYIILRGILLQELLKCPT